MLCVVSWQPGRTDLAESVPLTTCRPSGRPGPGETDRDERDVPKSFDPQKIQVSPRFLHAPVLGAVRVNDALVRCRFRSDGDGFMPGEGESDADTPLTAALRRVTSTQAWLRIPARIHRDMRAPAAPAAAEKKVGIPESDLVPNSGTDQTRQQA